MGDAHAPPPPASDTQHRLVQSLLVVQPAWHEPSSVTHFWPRGPTPVPDWQHCAVAVHAPPGPEHVPPLPPLLLPPLLLPPLLPPLLLLPGHGDVRALHAEVSPVLKHFWSAGWSGQSK